MSLSEPFSFTEGDGFVGLEEEAPFDAIHVGAAAESYQNSQTFQKKKIFKSFSILNLIFDCLQRSRKL
jgi:hypothetical protein